MDKFRIHGGVPLQGEIAVSGSKNSALPALAACLLTSEPVKLQRIPPVRDIGTMQQLLRHAGAEVDVEGGDVTVRAANLARPEAPYDLVKTMRAGSGTPYIVSAPGFKSRGQPAIGSVGQAMAEMATE